MTCDRCGDPIHAKAWRRADESLVCVECMSDAACAVPEDRPTYAIEERLHVIFHVMPFVPGCPFCRAERDEVAA
jgi:recombinational DNA repair protein (RecF pathway)